MSNPTEQLWEHATELFQSLCRTTETTLNEFPVKHQRFPECLLKEVARYH